MDQRLFFLGLYIQLDTFGWHGRIHGSQFGDLFVALGLVPILTLLPFKSGGSLHDRFVFISSWLLFGGTKRVGLILVLI